MTQAAPPGTRTPAPAGPPRRPRRAAAGGEPRWFGRPEVPLLGWVHAPRQPGAGGAVVLCPPLLGEQSPCHPVYRALARDLAAAGHRVVRFDYEGTGDSAGPSTGAGRVGAWLGSVDRAIELARAGSSGPLALVGMRMGALCWPRPPPPGARTWTRWCCGTPAAPGGRSSASSRRSRRSASRRAPAAAWSRRRATRWTPPWPARWATWPSPRCSTPGAPWS